MAPSGTAADELRNSPGSWHSRAEPTRARRSGSPGQDEEIHPAARASRARSFLPWWELAIGLDAGRAFQSAPSYWYREFGGGTRDLGPPPAIRYHVPRQLMLSNNAHAGSIYGKSNHGRGGPGSTSMCCWVCRRRYQQGGSPKCGKSETTHSSCSAITRVYSICRSFR
jgi:hypothetical protein